MTQDTEYPPSRVLIIDTDLGDYFHTKNILQKHFSEEYPHLQYSPQFLNERFPDNGLEVLTQGNIDLIILDPNTNSLKPETRRGLDEFLVPMRNRGYRTPVICLADPKCIEENEALKMGATAYAPKGDDDSLCKALNALYQPIKASAAA